MIRGVFFDYGGTLGHQLPMPLILGDILKGHGYEFDLPALTEATDFFGEQWEAKYSGFPRGRRWTDAVRVDCDRASLMKLGLQDDLDELAAEVAREWPSASRQQLFNDVLPTLDLLRASGFAMGVITQNLATSEEMTKLLEGFGIARYFDIVLTTEDAGYDKPDPRLYLHAAKQIGLEPKELCHIGDDYSRDVEGARAAGILPILIDRKENSDRKDCLVVESLSEVANTIKELV